MKPLREQLIEEYEKVSHLHTSTYTAREYAGFALAHDVTSTAGHKFVPR